MTFKDKTNYNYESFLKTQELIKSNTLINSSLSNVRYKIYTEMIKVNKRKKYDTKIMINGDSIVDSIIKYRKNRPCAVITSSGVLNKNTGKHDTEEDSIYRSTTLYTVVDRVDFVRNYFLPNKNSRYIKSDNAIYLENILLFKKDELLLDQKSYQSIKLILSTPPDLSKSDIDDSELMKVLYKRLKMIFDIALDNNVGTLILSDYGCNTFNIKPVIVANVMKKLLEEYDGCFKNIIFSIKSKDFSDIIYHTFNKIIMGS